MTTNEAGAVSAPIRVNPPGPFNFNQPEEWPVWAKRFERYLSISNLDAKPNKEKIDLFCYCAGDKAEEILRQVVPDPQAATFEEVRKAFDDYFEPKKNIIFERAKFNVRVQAAGEPVDEFITSLHTLAEKCEYATLKDQLIRDRIVIGVRDTKVSEQMQLLSDLTLVKAIQMARQAESVAKQTELIRPAGAEEAVVNKVFAKQKDFPREGCIRCGLNKHQMGRPCPAQNSTCRSCGKMGHWQRVCRSRDRSSNSGGSSSSGRVVRAVKKLEDDEIDGANIRFINYPQRQDGETEFEVSLENVTFGNKTNFVIDTGADITCIPLSHVPKQFRREICKTMLCVYGPNEQPLSVVGSINVKVKFQNKTFTMTAYVIKNLKVALLGKVEISRLKLLKRVYQISTAKVKSSVKPLEMFPQLFNGLGKMKKKCKIELVDNAKPFCQNVPRVVPLPLLDKLKTELDRLQKLKVIEQVDFPTEWCSPIVCVPKETGIRLCCDYTELNRCVKRSVFPLPKVDVTLAKLKNAKVFSKLDANAGFHQIELEEESKPLTTFITPFGRFMYNRLPFGVNCAPEFFSKNFSEILAGIPGVEVHADDVLVFADSMENHDRILTQVLKRLEEAQVTINEKKCLFGVNTVDFLGHRVSKEGISVLPDRVKAIVNFPVPKNKLNVLQFLGMVNFAAKFLPNKSEIVDPLNALIKDDAQFVWFESQQRAFDDIKRLLQTAPMLAHFDYKKKIIVQADASSYGIGGVLIQENTSGDREVVAYTSRKLSDGEQKYSQIEKEALSLVHATEKFKDFVTGINIILETDHKPLLQVLQSKPLDDLTPRLQRIRMRLMRYNYEVRYVPGKQLVLADSLSRNPVAGKQEDLEIEFENAKYVRFVVENIPATNDMINLIKSEQEKDHVCTKIREFCVGEWPAVKHLSEELKPYHAFRNDISLVQDILMFNSRLLIPASLQETILKRLHEGHLGVNKCRARAMQSVWWLGLSSQLTKFIKFCPKCVENRINHKEEFVTQEFPTRPWQKVALDLFKLDKWVLVITDYYSRFFEVVEMKKLTEKDVVVACQEIFARYGIPDEVRSDNGPQFRGEFGKFAKNYGFKHVTSSPYYPQSNGQAENAVKIAKKILLKSDDINLGLLAYRTTPLENGFSPAEMMFSRQIKSTVPVHPNELGTCIHDGQIQLKELELKNKQKENYNKRHRTSNLSELKIGDAVWVVDKKRYGTIIDYSERPNSFLIRIGEKDYRRNRWHLIEAPYKKPEAVSVIENPRLRANYWPADRVVVNEEVNVESMERERDVNQGELVLAREIPQPQQQNVNLNENSSERPVRNRRPPSWMRDYIPETD